MHRLVSTADEVWLFDSDTHLVEKRWASFHTVFAYQPEGEGQLIRRWSQIPLAIKFWGEQQKLVGFCRE